MFKFTKTGVFICLFFLIFIIIQILIFIYPIKTEISENIMQENQINEENSQITEETSGNETVTKEEVWQIEIPKISLKAIISDGTTKEILNKYVGHFEMTSKQLGNIGLAAHNRGYKVNYFKDLKFLEKGDEIIYRYNDFEMLYEVEKCRIIKDTDWEYLEETEENMLTLITCVENQPEYRRCIQAVEKEEELY